MAPLVEDMAGTADADGREHFLLDIQSLSPGTLDIASEDGPEYEAVGEWHEAGLLAEFPHAGDAWEGSGIPGADLLVAGGEFLSGLLEKVFPSRADDGGPALDDAFLAQPPELLLSLFNQPEDPCPQSNDPSPVEAVQDNFCPATAIEEMLSGEAVKMAGGG